MLVALLAVACGSATPSDPSVATVSAGGPRAAGPLDGMLRAHNRARARHCAKPLVWSDALARHAQRWADQLRARGCAFEHSSGQSYGENLAFFAPVGSADAARVTQAWYAEKADYSYRQARFSMKTGHFTQLIWANTRSLGCGVARCGGGELWVCNYDPPGNVIGAFASNVKSERCR